MGDDGAASDVAFAAFHSSATRLVSDDAAEDTVSHLAAVGASLATMEDSVIERSLDFILFPVVGVMRRASEPETNDADANPKARARRIKTLEESLRCVSAVLRRLEPGMGEPAFIGDLFCDVVAVLARSGSDPSLDDPVGARSSSSSADLEDLRLAAVTCASDVVRLIRPRTTHARALLADKNLPAVGYATSLLVRVAHLEASAGTKGSKAIRCAALATLRDLVANTDDPDAWSFFLPGVVSGLAKALHAASGSRSDEGAGPAGAADDSASTEAAIEALTAIVTCVLDDTCNVVQQRDTDGGDAGDDVVERLRRMAEDGREGASVLRESSSRVDEDEDEDDVASDGPPPAGADTSQAAAHLKVRRTARWLKETAPRVEQALAAALTPAVSHRKPSVRRTAALAAAAVIKHCHRTLRGAKRTLLECALVARGDPWDAVSGPATEVLDGLRSDGYVDDEVLDSIVAEALGDLPKLVRRGAAGGDGGRACAQRAIAAMATAGSARVARMFLTKYAVRSVTCAGLAQCFAVSADLASVGRSNELRALGQLSGVTNGAGGAGTDADADTTTSESKEVTIRENGTAYVPVLPRQPPRMLHLSNPELYDAVAKVARAVGSHCAADDGSGALAAIVDAHLDALRDSLEDARSPGSLWQRSACAHVAALNETLRGAGEYLPGPATHVRTESNSSEVFAASRSILQEYLGHTVWDLPTSLDDVSPERVVDGSITLATLRDDALLVCLAAEGVGVVAQACGVEFVRAGAFLPTALCPLLQKLGDPAAVVSDTASDVLAVIAAVGGFVQGSTKGSTQDGGSTVSEGPVASLVSANADYVVDMLSRHLRHLDDHPGAARFFAAVLGKRTGAARRTLHLLHEPVRRALDSMGIGARRKNWRHAGTFLGCLREVSDAACAEAASLLESANEAVEDVRPLHDLIEEMERVRSEQFGDDEDDESDDTEGGAAKAAMAEASMRAVIESSDHSDAAKAVDVPAVIVEWNRRVRHESSLSRLVAGVLTSASPLLESSDPRVRLAAAEVCASSLSAVAACDACSAPESAVYDTVKKLHPHDVPQTHGDNERPVRVLPRVHQLWPHLVHGLGHRLGPQVLPEPFKASLTLLERCAEVSGGEFIARRMASDAWPQLARVLELGVKHAESASIVKRMETLYLGAEDSFFDTSAHSNDLNDVDEDGLAGGTRGRETVASAPRTTETVRVAILKTLAAIGACEKSKGALRDVASNAADAVVPFTHAHGRRRARGSSPHTPEVMGAARDAVMGLAAVAPDAVWTALATSASSVDDFYVKAPRWRRDPGLGGATPPALPEFREIMPVARAGCGVSREEAAASLELLVECGMAVSN